MIKDEEKSSTESQVTSNQETVSSGGDNIEEDTVDETKEEYEELEEIEEVNNEEEEEEEEEKSSLKRGKKIEKAEENIQKDKYDTESWIVKNIYFFLKLKFNFFLYNYRL